MAKWTLKQQQRLDILTAACRIKENFSLCEKATLKGTLEFTFAMAKEAASLGRKKVGVRTGQTRHSITVRKGKYTNSSVYVETWLRRWIDNGGGMYHNNKYGSDFTDKSLSGRSYRKAFHTASKRRRISEAKMLKSHPAYYLLRPAKALARSVKAKKTYEKCLKLQEKKWSVDND